MKTIHGLSFIVIVAMAACGPPRLDGSSRERLEASVAKVRGSLPEELKPAFDSAMTVVAMADVDLKGALAQVLAGGDSPLAGIQGAMLDKVNGLTGRQVIARSDSIRVRRLEEEADTMAKVIEQHEAEVKEMAKVALSDPHLDIRGNSFFTSARLRLTLANGLQKALKNAYVSVKLISPDREVPWIEEDDVYFSFAGGIAPGETLTDFGYLEDRWRDAAAHKDARLEVQLNRVGFADDTGLGQRAGSWSFGSAEVPTRAALAEVRSELARLQAGR